MSRSSLWVCPEQKTERRSVANEAFLGFTTISRCQHVEDPGVNNPILAAVILPLLVWRSALSPL
jgi:hypothetical protein